MSIKLPKYAYYGLRRQNTYDEVVNYLESGQETIKYPDRTAKFLRNSPYMTQLDGVFNEMSQQDLDIVRNKQRALKGEALNVNKGTSTEFFNITDNEQVTEEAQPIDEKKVEPIDEYGASSSQDKDDKPIGQMVADIKNVIGTTGSQNNDKVTEYVNSLKDTEKLNLLKKLNSENIKYRAGNVAYLKLLTHFLKDTNEDYTILPNSTNDKLKEKIKRLKDENSDNIKEILKR